MSLKSLVKPGINAKHMASHKSLVTFAMPEESSEGVLKTISYESVKKPSERSLKRSAKEPIETYADEKQHRHTKKIMPGSIRKGVVEKTSIGSVKLTWKNINRSWESIEIPSTENLKEEEDNLPQTILSCEILTSNDSQDPSYTKLEPLPYYLVCRRRLRQNILKLRQQFSNLLQDIGLTQTRGLFAIRVWRFLGEPITKPLKKTEVITMNSAERFSLNDLMEGAERRSFYNLPDQHSHYRHLHSSKVSDKRRFLSKSK